MTDGNIRIVGTDGKKGSTYSSAAGKGGDGSAAIQGTSSGGKNPTCTTQPKAAEDGKSGDNGSPGGEGSPGLMPTTFTLIVDEINGPISIVITGGNGGDGGKGQTGGTGGTGGAGCDANGPCQAMPQAKGGKGGTAGIGGKGGNGANGPTVLIQYNKGDQFSYTVDQSGAFKQGGGGEPGDVGKAGAGNGSFGDGDKNRVGDNGNSGTAAKITIIGPGG